MAVTMIRTLLSTTPYFWLDMGQILLMVTTGSSSKNSWGDMWGDIMTEDAGYIKLRRRSEPMCGTNSSPLDGAACQDGGVESVHVCGTCGVISDNSYPIGVHYTRY